MFITRDSDGLLPAYAWPGGYPIVYIMADGAMICPDCANRKNGSEATIANEDPQWRIVGAQINYEDSDEFCAHCNKNLEAAYV